MKHLGGIAAVGCALALGCSGAMASGANGAVTPGAARAALWRTYDMLVDFHNLPRTYTCDELWYEFHGILLWLGAWPYSINILPYDCSPSPSGAMRSPEVQVRFQLPFFLHGVAVKTAPAEAVERTIRLAPGEPKTLHSSDCQLMRQISGSLLASIPVHVDEERFDCPASERAAPFTVRLTLPVGVKIPVVAATAARGPH
ncbi:MAG: hypothetical protein ACREV7_00705 [Steroidobacteraceae bacterium]